MIHFKFDFPIFEVKQKQNKYLLPAETIDTMIEVEVEDDCTSTVTRIPIIRPTIGFLTYSLFKTSPENEYTYYYYYLSHSLPAIYIFVSEPLG